MTLTAPPRPPETGETEALIEEARRRARRRRRWYGLWLLLVALGVGLYFAVGRGGGSGGGPPASSARPGPQPPSRAKQRQQIARVGARIPIGEAGLVAPGLGWAMNGLGLWWTRDGGAHWRSIAPPAVRASGDVVARVVDIAAVDDGHIWVAAADIQGSKLVNGSTRHMEIERTADGGKTWRSSIPPGCYGCGGAQLSFLDARRGFALIGALPHVPRLYETTDGGASWRRVPSDVSFTGPIRFVNAREGWAVSEPSRMTGPSQSVPVGGGIVYRTGDGGRHWRRVMLTAPPRYRGQAATDGIPRFFDAREGVVPVRFRDRSGAQHVVVYLTNDGGRSWSAHPAPSAAVLRSNWGFPEGLPFSAASGRDWFLLIGPRLYATHDAGRGWSRVETVAPKAPRVWDVGFTLPRVGWAVFALAGLGPQVGPALVRTDDGGRTWTALSPH